MSEFHEFGKVTSDSQAWALLVTDIQSQPKGCSFLSVTKPRSARCSKIAIAANRRKPATPEGTNFMKRALNFLVIRGYLVYSRIV